MESRPGTARRAPPCDLCERNINPLAPYTSSAYGEAIECSEENQLGQLILPTDTLELLTDTFAPSGRGKDLSYEPNRLEGEDATGSSTDAHDPHTVRHAAEDPKGHVEESSCASREGVVIAYDAKNRAYRVSLYTELGVRQYALPESIAIGRLRAGDPVQCYAVEIGDQLEVRLAKLPPKDRDTAELRARARQIARKQLDDILAERKNKRLK